MIHKIYNASGFDAETAKSYYNKGEKVQIKACGFYLTLKDIKKIKTEFDKISIVNQFDFDLINQVLTIGFDNRFE